MNGVGMRGNFRVTDFILTWFEVLLANYHFLQRY